MFCDDSHNCQCFMKSELFSVHFGLVASLELAFLKITKAVTPQMEELDLSDSATYHTVLETMAQAERRVR